MLGNVIVCPCFNFKKYDPCAYHVFWQPISLYFYTAQNLHFWYSAEKAYSLTTFQSVFLCCVKLAFFVLHQESIHCANPSVCIFMLCKTCIFGTPPRKHTLWQPFNHTPSTHLWHPSFGGRSRKAMLRVCLLICISMLYKTCFSGTLPRKHTVWQTLQSVFLCCVKLALSGILPREHTVRHPFSLYFYTV